MGNVSQLSIRQSTEFLLAQQVVDTLQNFFPGWEWAAMVDGGVLYIKNQTLSDSWAIQQKADLVSRRSVMEAGGEFLERFNMPVRFDEGAVANAQRDFSGAIVSEKWTPDRRYWNKTEQRWKA